ncbi:MAG: hypothetical protein ACXW1Z_22105 [Methylobacter sp.]
MLEAISIFDVIKRGGYEASLITTFNATLPFYEEVILRKLVGAGCQHNVVLMDSKQCAQAWESEASRPRLAGYAYTLLPVGVPGAFHPKVCLLLGPKKATILIGSHNLTLSGFGYNREVTNCIEVASSKDAEGAALLNTVWQMVRQWIELERNTVHESLLESALAIANFVTPLAANASTMTSTIVIAQTPGGSSLIKQLAENVSPNVKRIGVIGAFFDHDQMFIKELQRHWPLAEIVIGIDPETVHLPGIPDTTSFRYVDACQLWPDTQGYLHAKALFLDTGDATTDAFVSGSANPSRPAWMATAGSGNVEAVLLRTGTDARATAEVTGIGRLFDLPALAPEVFAAIAQRSAASNNTNSPKSIPLWTGIANQDVEELRISCSGKSIDISRAALLGPNMDILEETENIDVIGAEIVLRPTIELTRIRSCVFANHDSPVARAMILHPSALSVSSCSSKQYQIRSALNSLDSSEGDISKVIAAVERVIFADEVTYEVDNAVREHQAKRAKTSSTAGPPDSLAISVADMPETKKRARLLKAGDLAYLIDVLLRRLSEGLEIQSIETDSAGRTEEEQIDKDDVDTIALSEVKQSTTTLSDREIAIAVARRSRALICQMIKQLELAAKNETRQAGAVFQLIAVLALLRELRHLDKLERWQRTGQPLAEERDRRRLLDESLKYLLGPNSLFINIVDKVAGERTDETAQLRVLLLWLAWDLGEELTDQIDRIWDTNERCAKLKANAVFLNLMPEIAGDKKSCSDLNESISKTVRLTPEAAMRATNWLTHHLHFGNTWSKGYRESDILSVGGYCHLLGQFDEPHVVFELSEKYVGFWDQGRVRKFERIRVVGVIPAST